MEKLNCFYVPGAPQIIDVAVLTSAGEWVSQVRGMNLMLLRDENPEVVMGDLDEWVAQHEKSLIGTPEEINKAEWWEALECLPPEGWHNLGGGESFKMMEYYSGRVTSIYVRILDRYFTWHDVASLPHLDCLAKVRRAFPDA